jgi:hypothetical protein
MDRYALRSRRRPSRPPRPSPPVRTRRTGSAARARADRGPSVSARRRRQGRQNHARRWAGRERCSCCRLGATTMRRPRPSLRSMSPPVSPGPVFAEIAALRLAETSTAASSPASPWRRPAPRRLPATAQGWATHPVHPLRRRHHAPADAPPSASAVPAMTRDRCAKGSSPSGARRHDRVAISPARRRAPRRAVIAVLDAATHLHLVTAPRGPP